MTGGIPRSYDRNMHGAKALLLNLVLCFSLLLSINCAAAPVKTDIIPAAGQPIQPPHIRKLMTPQYAGGGGVIFVLDQINEGLPGDALDKVVAVFGQYNAPLNVALTPSQLDTGKGYADQLLSYSDAGIIDISIDGYPMPWLPPQATSSNPVYTDLQSVLSKSRDLCKYYFGEAPVTCLIPPSAFNEANYSPLKQAGFKVLCAASSSYPGPSTQPGSWSAKIDPDGFYRLPVVEAVEFDSALLDSARQSVRSLGIAVIKFQPATLLGQDGKTDTTRLLQLTNLIKSCQELGQITTLESWYKYSALALASSGRERPLPPYSGGPVIIFRLDDVAKGYHEDVVQEIIGMFQKNGVPVDCGVVSNANGIDSYDIPWLKQYFDQDAVGISVHGYDWTYFQLDTSKSNLSYQEIKSKLIATQRRYMNYFGINPVALTVPTDFFDQEGYRAVMDAGYKIFATQIVIEPHPSAVYPVDFLGNKDPKGMYRIPTASDVCAWNQDNQSWVNIYDVGDQSNLVGLCNNLDTTDAGPNELTIMLCTTLKKVGVVAVGIHPACFVDKSGRPDIAKLEKLNMIISWCKSFATIMTFEQWYRYRTGEK